MKKAPERTEVLHIRRRIFYPRSHSVSLYKYLYSLDILNADDTKGDTERHAVPALCCQPHFIRCDLALHRPAFLFASLITGYFC